MTLNADSTFLYEGDSGDIFYTFGSTGRWSRRGNRLLLDNDRLANVLEARNTGSEQIVVDVVMPDGQKIDRESVAWSSVMIVGVPGVSETHLVSLDENGRAAFPKQEFSELIITHMSRVEIMNFHIKDNRHDYFRVARPRWDRYTDFENEIWRIGGKTLIERHGKSPRRYYRE
jgi:hypothetical protein